MPLPWKRTKTNPISRIVADLHPPSRRASLVVETGFPTSVIDLFVKNRDRMKWRSCKKRRNAHYDGGLHICESIAPPPTPSLSPVNSSLRLAADEAVVVIADCSRGGHVLRGDSPPPEVELVGGRANTNTNTNANGNGGSVFLVAVKMFLVVVPALTTKKLAFGITLSVFLLLLLQLFVKFALGFFKPRSDADADVGMSCWIRKRIFFQSDTTAGESTKRDDEGLIVGVEEESSHASDEIQIVEPNFICSSHAMDYADYADMLEEQDLLSREKRRGYPPDVEGEECKHLVGKNERSRSAKLKAKIIKKLIPKKLRSGKRVNKAKNKESKVELRSQVADHDHEQDEQEKENGSASSCEEEEEEEDEEEEEWQAADVGTMGKGEEERNTMECIFVVSMILLGLLGGQILAVVATVSGCFVLKLIKILNEE